MDEHDVVIVGGGPTGLMLAAELAIAGIDAVIVERRLDQHVDGSRAGGLLARSIEVLDQRGVAERFLEAGYTVPAHSFAGIPLDLSDLPTRHPYVLALPQRDLEPILAAWVDELGVPWLRGHEVIGCTVEGDGVLVQAEPVGGDAPRAFRARYVVGCDGGRSVVRDAAGIGSTGLDPTTSWLVAEVEMSGAPELGLRLDELGTHGIGPMGDGGPYRVVVTERELHRGSEPALAELSAGLVDVYGTDFGVHSPSWLSRFTDLTRLADTYRAGRILLAGDAAHVHPPQGGQGLNTGVQDAVNLGWKLAQVVAGTSPDTLLDTYGDERRPVAARVLHNTMAQVALGRADARHHALRDTMTDLLAMREPRHHIASMLCALDLHYDLGEGHPLVGRRMPDLDLETATGPTRVYELLHDAKPVLLDLGSAGDATAVDAWSDRVRVVNATAHARWVLPLSGEVPAPASALIRPDGHVAWVGEPTEPSLLTALTTWFGPASA